MWRGLLVGVCLWLVALVVFKVVPISHSALLWAGFAGLALPVGGLIYGLAKRFAVGDTARWLDLKTGLKERLGTAVELADGKAARTDWSDLVLRDAALAARQIEPGKLIPLRVPKKGHWILLLLVACVGLGFVPEHRSQAYLDQQRDAVIIKDVGRNLDALTKLQIKMSPPHFESTEESLESVQELGRELKRGKLVRDKALAKLSSLAERLRGQSSTLGQAQTRRSHRPAKSIRVSKRNAFDAQSFIRSMIDVVDLPGKNGMIAISPPADSTASRSSASSVSGV